MAQRRMFSLQIVDTDAFLEMPATTQLLYFHLSMRADDDGFVSNPKKIMKMINCNDDDLKILLAKRFLLGFESGVIVIKHWRMNNYIQSDRYKETVYCDEKKLLTIKENGAYTDNCIQNVSSLDTQVRLGKSKDRDNNNIIVADFELAELLQSMICLNNPNFKRPTNLNSWADDVRKMRELDNRTYEQIKYLIEWSQKDTFWQSNILSMKTLRRQFDKLVAQVKRSRQQKNTLTIAE